MEGSPVAVHAVCILLAVLSLGLTEMFVKAAAGHQGVFAGLFQTTTQNVLKTFPIEVSLDGWVGSTWIILNVWTAGWLVYAFSTVIRRNIFGPICCNPEIHPPSNYLIWIFINTLRICWLFLWDRQYISVAIGVKMLVPICSYYMLFVSYRNLHRHNTWLTINCPNERWYIRFMTQNGLALFASWTFIEALINVGVALKYRVGLPDPLVSAIVLTVLLLGMLLWFVFESFIFSQYILYTFTVFPVAVLCLGAMFTNSYRFDDLAPITIYCGFLMIVATVLNSIRLVAVCFYKQTKPTILSLPSFPPAYNGEPVHKLKVHENMSGKSGVVNNQFSEN
ncbi:uncharacterized protein LOC118225883 [Anguilla anguilla]|uniref:uncharacterized protein LOC118225883 n=1 Tax=Anguilla anguilla TaxID=7936 RepID=UPI0015A84A5C|nr:uncharacterized protein LOC118225883 [Anguilla anguilla]